MSRLVLAVLALVALAAGFALYALAIPPTSTSLSLYRYTDSDSGLYESSSAWPRTTSFIAGVCQEVPCGASSGTLTGISIRATLSPPGSYAISYEVRCAAGVGKGTGSLNAGAAWYTVKAYAKVAIAQGETCTLTITTTSQVSWTLDDANGEELLVVWADQSAPNSGSDPDPPATPPTSSSQPVDGDPEPSSDDDDDEDQDEQDLFVPIALVVLGLGVFLVALRR